MPGLQDGIKSHPLVTLGLAAVTVVPLAVPSARGPWAQGLKAVVKLWLEAEAGAEADIIDSLADAALDQLCEALAHAEPEARHEAARAVIRRYAKRAHRRSARPARDEADQRRRYARHISALEKRISHRRALAVSDDHRKRWDNVLSALEAAAAPPAPSPSATEQGGAEHAVHR